MLYKNRNGVLFIPTSEDSENISGVSITIADNIRGKYHGYIILRDYESDKIGFNWAYFKASHDDYENVVDLVFSIMISDERGLP